MIPERIELTPAEVQLAALVGALRRHHGLTTGRRDTGSPYTRWQRDVEGCGGEVALAKALDVFWSGTVGTVRAPYDVGTYQVRTVARPTDRLILRPDDPLGAIFVLVVGLLPTFRLRGWIRAAAARRPEWLDAPAEREPAWFVPPDALAPLATLPGATRRGLRVVGA